MQRAEINPDGTPADDWAVALDCLSELMRYCKGCMVMERCVGSWTACRRCLIPTGASSPATTAVPTFCSQPLSSTACDPNRAFPDTRSRSISEHRINNHPYRPFPLRKLVRTIAAVQRAAYPEELWPLLHHEHSHVYTRRTLADDVSTSSMSTSLPGPPSPGWAPLAPAALRVTKQPITYEAFGRTAFPKVMTSGLPPSCLSPPALWSVARLSRDSLSSRCRAAGGGRGAAGQG